MIRKFHLTIIVVLIATSILKAQEHSFEFGMGIKYDKFNIDQPENLFQCNIDLGAIAFISYGRPINKKLSLVAGFATNNYKLNFKIKTPSGEFFSTRELVSVMRSNRLFLNIQHNTKEFNSRLSWVNTLGITLLIGSKNPYDVVLERGKSIETANGSESIDVKIQTYGLTGSAVLIGVGTKLYYRFSKDFKLVADLAMITGTGQLSKVDVNYALGSSTVYKKVVFSTNGFAPFFTLGVNYIWKKEP